MKQDFIGNNARRFGTTWLYERLASNPEFSMFPIKELYYFDRSPGYSTPNTLSEAKLISRLKKENG